VYQIIGTNTITARLNRVRKRLVAEKNVARGAKRRLSRRLGARTPRATPHGRDEPDCDGG